MTIADLEQRIVDFDNARIRSDDEHVLCFLYKGKWYPARLLAAAAGARNKGQQAIEDIARILPYTRFAHQQITGGRAVQLSDTERIAEAVQLAQRISELGPELS